MTRIESQKSLWARKIRQRMVHYRHAGDGPRRGIGPDRRMRKFQAAGDAAREHHADPVHFDEHRTSGAVDTHDPVAADQSARQTSPPVQTTPTGTPSCATSALKVRLVRARRWRYRRHVLLPAAIHERLRAHLPALRLSRCVGLSQRASGRRGRRPRGRLGQAHGDAPARGDRPQRAALSNVGDYPASGVRTVIATALKVYPPNETVATYVPYRFDACSLTTAIPGRLARRGRSRARPRPRLSFPARSHWDGSGRT